MKNPSGNEEYSYMKIHCNEPRRVWLSWLEDLPIHQKFVGSIRSQVTCLGCGFDLSLGA